MRRGRRLGAGACVLGAALILHLAALGALEGGVAPSSLSGAGAGRPIAVRLLPVERPSAGPSPEAVTEPVPDPAAVPSPADLVAPVAGSISKNRGGATARTHRRPAAVAARRPVDAPAPPADAGLAPVSLEAVVLRDPEPVRLVAAPDVGDTPAATEREADPETEPIPHYPTRIPPPVSLRYDVRRGALSGVGQIDWKTGAGHYDLKLEFRYAGLLILEQSSAGGFDADGLAPDRFVDRRIRRSAQAANFQRGTHRLTYSGSADDHLLRAGAQDRLSWMIQLAAIVSADPALARPGARVTMYVTGARGDIAVWTFRCTGPEPLELRIGRIDAVRFVREPAHERDTQVKAWLDPARHYLPAAATQQSGPDDEPYELRLTEANELR